MDDKEKLAVLHFLENVIAGITRINSDLLEAVKNVDSMTRTECCTSLVELKKTLNDLTPSPSPPENLRHILKYFIYRGSKF